MVAAPPEFALGRFLLDGRPIVGLVVGGQVLPLPTPDVNGANYRTHVIDLAVKHAEIRPGMTSEQVRAEVAATMDRRAAQGEPYLFGGLPSAVAGPYDDVALPGYSEQADGFVAEAAR